MNKKNCPFRLRFQITKDGHALQCVKFISEHNHQISQELFKLDYTQRKLEANDQLEVANMLKMDPNRKLVKKHYEEKSDQLHTTSGAKQMAENKCNLIFIFSFPPVLISYYCCCILVLL